MIQGYRVHYFAHVISGSVCNQSKWWGSCIADEYLWYYWKWYFPISLHISFNQSIVNDNDNSKSDL